MEKEKILNYLKKFVEEDETLKNKGESYGFRCCSLLGKLEFVIEHLEQEVSK